MGSNGRSGSIVDVRGLSKYYGPFIAVHGVSFTIPQGQIVALLGPNGAGKTTIMRMLTGYLAPSSGTASIAGFDVQKERLQVAASIGYLPENGPLYLDMTPVEALRFFGEARGLSVKALQERIDAVAAQCNLQAVLDKPIGKLSKGLRQRVGVAQALLHDPPVLIMDEPRTGLDPIQVRQYRAQVRGFGGHKTVIVSTHVLDDLKDIVDRVLIISRGRLVFDGPVDALAVNSSLEERFYELTRDSAVVEENA
jgi:ABC-2 type transport system ATP-binding protein